MRQSIAAVVGVFACGVVACSGTGDASTGAEEQVGSATAAVTSVSVWKSSWKGASAQAFSYTDTGYTSVNVWEDTSKTTRQAFMQFNSYSVDPNSYLCQTEEYCKGDPGAGGSPGAGGDGSDGCEEYTWCSYTKFIYSYGWGAIPADSFKVKGQADSAQLKLDLANAPGFFTTTCTQDATSYTCTSGGGSGVIDVGWKSNGISTSSSNGVSSQTYGAYSFRSTGQSDSKSADVTGTLLGSPVQAQGSVQTSKGTSVSKEVIKN